MSRSTARPRQATGAMPGAGEGPGPGPSVPDAGNECSARPHRSALSRVGAVLGTLGLGAALLAACSGTPRQPSHLAKLAGNAPWMAKRAAAAGATGPTATVSLQIEDVSTPEGSEPAYVGSGGVGSPVLFTAKAGQTVKVVVVNHDAMPHTFTSPDLGVNAAIAPESTSTFSFTAPSAGTFSWYCTVPCGDWVMSHAGYMKGSVTVTA